MISWTEMQQKRKYRVLNSAPRKLAVTNGELLGLAKVAYMTSIPSLEAMLVRRVYGA
jgi:hypothetical protein